MIKVLQDWLEIGEAYNFLSRNGLADLTTSAQRNWDHYQLYRIVEAMPPHTKVVDLGCGRAGTLKLLYAIGFKHLYGIDLSIGWRDRVSQLYLAYKTRSFRPPYHLVKRNIVATRFADKMFDLAVCISTIEHGVEPSRFLAETSRILKPGTLLLITTDYWEKKIHGPKDLKPFGLPWTIYSKEEIEQMIRLARAYGFVLYEDSPIPPCSDRPVVWNDQEYTFLLMLLRKRNA